MSNLVNSPAYHEAVLMNLMERDEVTMGNGIVFRKMSDMENEFHLRLIVPMEMMDRAGDLNRLAYDLITTMLSETTNNDACDVSIRERSAHFDQHDDLAEFHDRPFGSTVIIDAIIHDSLT